jgi:aminopeptidase C
MTHAMVISGVHVDEKTGRPVRFKVENSWGDESCYKGYMVMSDKWFDEYVLCLVTRFALDFSNDADITILDKIRIPSRGAQVVCSERTRQGV